MRVHTDKLRDGDKVHFDGAVIKIEGKPETTLAPGNRLIYYWPNAPIVAGRLRDFPHTTAFTVMGMAARTWNVTRSASR